MNILSCDIGTSRVKAAIVDSAGRIVSMDSRRIDRTSNPEEQEPDEWYSIVCSLLRSMDLSSACGVVLTGNMHALLGVDASGECVAPAVLWTSNMASDEAEILQTCYGGAILSEFGNPPSCVFTLPKLMHMKKHAPELYLRTRYFLQPKDFITYRLTDAAFTDPCDASGVLLAVPGRHEWCAPLADELGIDLSKMPPILKSTDFAGRVTHKAALETGICEGLPVIVGTGDLASAALGSGVDDDTFSLTLGTAGQLLADGAPGEGEKIKGRLFVFDHAEEGRELYLGSVPAGGMSLEWMSKMLGMTMDEFFIEAEKTHCASSELPLFYPYISGRGAPYMDYRHNGIWKGLSSGHDRADLCRAAAECVVFPLKQCADLMEGLQHERSKIVLHALACREGSVRESACRIFRQTKFLPELSEASLLGASMIGFTALGIHASFDAARKNMVRSKAAADVAADVSLYEKWLAEMG